MPKKAKIKDKNGGDSLIMAVFQQVQDATDVPETLFRDKRNRDSGSLFARNLAISLLRLTGLGQEKTIQPFGLKSTQTVYQAADLVRKAVKADPEIGTQIRKICANLGVDPTPLLGSEQKKPVVPKMADLFIAAAGASQAVDETRTTSSPPEEEAVSVFYRTQNAVHSVFLPDDELFSKTGISSAGLAQQVLAFVLVSDYGHELEVVGTRLGMDKEKVFAALGTVWYLARLGGETHEKLEAVHRLLHPEK